MTAQQVKRLSVAMAAAILIAGVFFYFLPAPVGFVRTLEIPRFAGLFRGLYVLDEATNTFPSLHIGLSYLIVRTLNNEKSLLKYLWLWFFLICLSVLFTHQHHIIDIFGGIILGEFCHRQIYLRSGPGKLKSDS